MKDELRGEGGSDVFSTTRHVNPNAVRARLHENYNFTEFMSRLLYIYWETFSNYRAEEQPNSSEM